MPQADSQTSTRPFQFSLRTMFILTAVVAAACGGLFAPWLWLQSLALFYLGVTGSMVTVVALIYTRGYARTFWIGTAFPAGTFLLAVAAEGDPFRILDTLIPELAGLDDPDMQRVVLGVHLLVAGTMILLAGLIAMGVRWMVESPQRTRAALAVTEPPHETHDFAGSKPTQESECDAG